MSYGIYIYHILSYHMELKSFKNEKHKNDEYDAITILSSLYPCTVWRLIMMQPGGFGFFKEFTFCSRKSLMRATAFQPVSSCFTLFLIMFHIISCFFYMRKYVRIQSSSSRMFESWQRPLWQLEKKSPASPSFGAFRALAHSGHRRVLAAWSVVCV